MVALSRLRLPAILLAFALAAPALADSVEGRWDGPVGPVRITRDGARVAGVLLEDSPVCPFSKGARVLEGTLSEGNLSGKVRLCTTGCAAAGAQWGFSMLVLRGDRLAGAAYVKAPGCRVPGRSAKGGVSFRRATEGLPPPPLARVDGGVAPRPAGPEAPPGSYDPRHAASLRERAMNVARDGLELLQAGRFEQARARFEAAVAIDPDYAEGLNGIGVTYALRRDWAEAVGWYQRSIAANPDIGDAYYNLACAYAQTERPELAVRYLRLAVLNGYSEVSHLTGDPDLEPLRSLEAYRAVVALGRIGAAP